MCVLLVCTFLLCFEVSVVLGSKTIFLYDIEKTKSPLEMAFQVSLAVLLCSFPASRQEAVVKQGILNTIAPLHVQVGASILK